MDEPAWLEVSLEVDGELAEAVAEVLARFAPEGVVIENAVAETSPAAYRLRVFCFIPEDDHLPEARRRIGEALGHLGQIQPLPDPQFRRIEQTNWMHAWKDRYHPIPVGRRLLILPAWIEPPKGEHLPIRIQPGLAFGTGAHPSTQLSLELLEAHLRPGTDVIDVGCGSGILAIAAARLGATRILAVDTNREALRWARENAALNGVVNDIEFGTGSVGEIQSGQFGLRHAPLVVANILAHILIELLENGLADLLSPDGILLLSGILKEQQPQIHSTLLQADLEIFERRHQEDWVALVVRQRV